VVSGLLDVGCTVLVPTFSWGFAVQPPPPMRPQRNGTDYNVSAMSAAGATRIFDRATSELDQDSMGAIPAAVLAMDGHIRGHHPLNSFAAVGPLAAEVVTGQEPLSVYQPLEALARLGGYAVLMGVGLTSMTLLHLAEQYAGRNPFRRWANGSDGRPMMVETGGCSNGFAAFDDGRHGHTSKVRAPVRQWLDAYCHSAPMVSGPAVQQALHERFGLTVSVRHINRIRAALNVTKPSRRVSTGRTGEDAATDLSSDTTWQDGAGSLLLLAAAHGTGLIPAFEAALPCDDDHLARLSLTSKRSFLLTLLFLNAVGLRRTWDLRAYAGDSLALLTGRHRAYGYRYVECFLSRVAHTDGAEALTDALATWTALLWQPCPSPTAASPEPPPTFYIDGHRKAVYSDRLIPRGLVARRGAVLGCRALTLLHDAAGHPLLALTDRGDTHLTAGAPALLARFARATDAPPVRRLVIDREGMAAAFLVGLADADCDVVTVLRADQYAGLASFTEIGPFAPFQYDRTGRLVREVAPARFALALPDHPGEHIDVRPSPARIRRRTRTSPTRGWRTSTLRTPPGTGRAGSPPQHRPRRPRPSSSPS